MLGTYNVPAVLLRSSLNPGGPNFLAGSSCLESQCLQQVTEVVTWANLPQRAGFLSWDFWDPTAWKQRDVCCPEMHKAEEGQPCASHTRWVTSNLELSPPPCFISNPSSKSGLVLFLLGSVPIQTLSQQDPSGSVHEKNMAFFCEAQKIQINSSPHLHRPKIGPRLCGPALQYLLRGPGRSVHMCEDWELGKTQIMENPLCHSTQALRLRSTWAKLFRQLQSKNHQWPSLYSPKKTIIRGTVFTFREPEKMGCLKARYRDSGDRLLQELGQYQSVPCWAQ